jgi:NAD(P)-dependent dehydrogenase (short-subunit alcohol dehydrogenase family)
MTIKPRNGGADKIGGRLDGRTCMVTGAARGIGQAYVRRLVAEGAHVVAVDCLSLEETIAVSGGEILPVLADVCSAQDALSAVAAAVDWHGRLDVLLNNAAFYGGITLGSFEDISTEEWDRAMDVNVKGIWRMSAAAAPTMRGQGGGTIINISSNVIFMGKPNFLHYVASKGAVWAMTSALSRELAGDGIRVNGIAPGYTVTSATRDLADVDTVARLEREILEAQSIKRLMGADDLTGVAVFLASDDSQFVTGQTITVDGGVIVG